MAIANRNKSIDIDHYVAAELFSSRVLKELAKSGRSKTFAGIVHESGIDSAFNVDTPICAIFDIVFDLLSKKHRTEHIFKSAIANKILLGRHSLNTAVIMLEFRVAANKADVVILNGTATAYEIKTDLDKLDRLSSQVESYLHVFARVCVVAAETHRENVIALIPPEVGLFLLTRRGSISPLREPIDNPSRIDPERVLEVLQIHEAIKVLQVLERKIPEVPNTRMYVALQDLFKELEPIRVHAAMVHVLRITRRHRDMSEFLELIPTSLHALTLAIPMNGPERKNLIVALRTPLHEALMWS